MPVRKSRGHKSKGIESEETSKKRLAGWLVQRFFVRFHISLILAFAVGVGLLATRGLFSLGLETMHWRWPLAMLAAYAAFLLGVRLWLAYVGLGRYLEREEEPAIDVHDLGFSGSGGDSGGVPCFGDGSRLVLDEVGGGGSFGGGGASGDFSDLAGSDLGNLSDSGSGISLPDIDLDVGGADEGCLPVVILVLVLALLAVVLGVGFYIVWQAPFMLAEVAFEAAMAAGLIRSARKVDDPGWIGGALSASWKPFLLIFLFSLIVAALAEKFAPQARTLPQIIQQLRQ
ncbi:hypothetical protein [Propionivibrio sp.]|uniref:hypothetical protein n=1 Tax=Propionivibrio sp. TaxID=2212460 RepID=UPI003BF0442E